MAVTSTAMTIQIERNLPPSVKKGKKPRPIVVVKSRCGSSRYLVGIGLSPR